MFSPLSLVAGSLLAVQAGANAQLAKAANSPVAATVIQVFIAGTLLLLVAAVTGTLQAFGDLARVPWWQVTGGLATAIYVASTIVLFPRLGAVVTVGLFIAGQMLASLALDSLGLLGLARQAPGPWTIVGAATVLAGAAAIVVGQKAASAAASYRPAWIALALLAGAVLPLQGAVNGLLRAGIGAPFVVAATSFATATLAMTTVLLFMRVTGRGPAPRLSGISRMPWWGWLGALCGATYVTTMFTAIPVIGAAAAVGLTVAGQQLASLFVDRHGWFRLPQRPLTRLRLAGVVLLLVGVGVLQGSR